MGWVTLSLRKKELQRTHSDLQMEDLQISRTQRQMARQYNYDQTVVQNDQQDALDDLQTAYKSQTSIFYDDIKTKREELNGLDPNDSNYESEKSRIQGEIDDLNQKIRDAQEQYNYDSNQTKELYETSLALIEEEAKDIETMYENEKVQVETQMEAIAAELEAVSEAVSQEIKNSTIKLS